LGVVFFAAIGLATGRCRYPIKSLSAVPQGILWNSLNSSL